MTNDLRYPVGRFAMPNEVTIGQREQWIEEIAAAPGQLRAAVDGLNEVQLDTCYRPDGWTVRQVVHHVPDSHVNAYIRMKWALTEDTPLIKIYNQDGWASLSDARTAPIELSLDILETLHRRWVLLLRDLGDEDFARAFQHPEWGRVTLAQNCGLYAWHGRHHVAHITTLREREGWT